ncbi:MAG: hypothetical protein AAB339_00165 [Elusimicrobiota bacterium]
MKTIILLLSSLMAALPAAAAGSEALRSDGDAGFLGLSRFQVKPLAGRRAAAQTQEEGAVDARVSASNSVRLSGNVRLQGHGYASADQHFIHLTLNGSMDVTDEKGRVLARNAQVMVSGSYPVSGNYVSGYAYPNIFVSLYDGGRYLGSANLSGSVHVSGFIHGNWAQLSGSGMLWGYANLRE